MPHNDTMNLALQVYTTFQRAEELGFLTDSGVAAADTKAGLINFVNGVSGIHAEMENWRPEIIRSINRSGLADADIAGLTTVAGLLALLGVSPTPAASDQAILG